MHHALSILDASVHTYIHVQSSCILTVHIYDQKIIHTSIYMHTPMNITYTYIHTYIHTNHIHTYIHTHTGSGDFDFTLTIHCWRRDEMARGSIDPAPIYSRSCIVSSHNH